MHNGKTTKNLGKINKRSILEQKAKQANIHQLWLFVFSIWLILLSGGMSSLVGSPGALQAFRLGKLLTTKETQLTQLKQELSRLKIESFEMETNRMIQIREIRRVLGYTAADEMIFDFNGPNSF